MDQELLRQSMEFPALELGAQSLTTPTPHPHRHGLNSCIWESEP